MSTTRREWLGQVCSAALVVAGGALVLSACKGGGGGSLSCTDTTGLSEADIATRTATQYVDAATDPAKKCSGCMLYVAGTEGACGTCTAVKGPINPEGSCTAWVARA